MSVVVEFLKFLQRLKIFYRKLNNLLTFSSIALLFVCLLCLGAYVGFLIITKNPQGGEVFLLEPLKHSLLATLVCGPRLQHAAGCCWGSLALGHSSEVLLTLIGVTLVVLGFLLGAAHYNPRCKLPLMGLLCLFAFDFLRIAFLAGATGEPFIFLSVLSTEGWALFPSWGIALHSYEGPSFAGLETLEGLEHFIQAHVDDYCADRVRVRGGAPAGSFKDPPGAADISTLAEAIEKQRFYSRADVLKAMARGLQGRLDFQPLDLLGLVFVSSFLSAGLLTCYYYASFPIAWLVSAMPYIMALTLALLTSDKDKEPYSLGQPVDRIPSNLNYDLAGELDTAFKGIQQTGWDCLWLVQGEYLMFSFFCVLVLCAFAASQGRSVGRAKRPRRSTLGG